jgi:hypothetical protein
MAISKKEFINDIKSAIAERRGFAAAKTGVSQKSWMYYEIFLSEHRRPEEIREYESSLKFHCLKQEGLFPESLEFYRSYNRFYMDHVKNLDCLGLFYRPALTELRIIKYYDLRNKFIYFPLQEPDRSSPTDESHCYLPLFKDKKLLIICPFADLLRQRASKEVFEKVWSKTGKQWFYPSTVEALELPYGFSPETHKKYPTVLDLFQDITRRLDRMDFDVALIAAGGLALPIASYIKNMGKVGIDLGGHLQIVFGVIGQRWRNWEDWRRDYFNEHWVDMPASYKPKEMDVCDAGAYW